MSKVDEVERLVKQLQNLLREESQEAVEFVKQYRRGMGRIRHLGNAQTLLVRSWQSYVAAAGEMRVLRSTNKSFDEAVEEAFDFKITLCPSPSSSSPHTEPERSELQERESLLRDQQSPAPSVSGDCE